MPYVQTIHANGHVGDITVAEVVQSFINHNPARTRSDATLKKRILEFAADLGHKPVSQCAPVDLIMWLDSRRDRFRSDWTRLGVANNVKRPFNWAVETARLIPFNPFAGVAMPEGDPAREMEMWELRMILRNSSAIFRRVVCFLWYSGCRPSEAADIEWSHFDEARGCVVLWKHKTINAGRHRKPRVLVLHPVALRLIAWIKRNGPDPRFVFVNTRGSKWDRHSLGKRIKRLRKKIGCKGLRSLYGLRHAIGCNAVFNGVPLPVVAEMLGHDSIRTTMRYVHVRGKVDHIRNGFIQALKRKA